MKLIILWLWVLTAVILKVTMEKKVKPINGHHDPLIGFVI